jgi:hypothetical protein
MENQIEQIDEDPEAPRIVHLSPNQRSDMLRCLAERGLSNDPKTIQKTAAAVWRATRLMSETMEHRAGGDWSPDGIAETFPAT